jgi:hypothetical protein
MNMPHIVLDDTTIVLLVLAIASGIVAIICWRAPK